MPETPTCYMAAKFPLLGATNEGWVDTGLGLNTPGLPTSTDGSLLPKTTAAYGLVYRAKFKAEREFEAINSSGGPQTAFRAGFTSLDLERYSDDSSPLFFEHCLTGQQIEWVYLTLPDQGNTTKEVYHVRLGGVFVSSYEACGERFWGRTIDDEYRNPEVAFTMATDELSLVFTQIAIESLDVEKGWDRRTAQSWNTPST